MIRHAIRRLLRAKTFTLAAVVTLMLGIGGTAAVFTLVDSVLLRPMPFEHADRLVDLSHVLDVSGPLHVDQSDATYLLYRRENRVFTDVGAYRATSANVSIPSSAEAGRAERVNAVLATASVFRALRAVPAIGRGMTEADVDPGAPKVVVLSHRLWTRQCGADPRAIDASLLVDGVMRKIVGVMPPDFEFPTADARLWIPLQLDAANTKSAAFDYRGIARLRDGVSLASATADLQRLLPRVPEAFPGRLTAGAIEATHMKTVVRPLRDVVVGDVGRVLWIVFGAVGLLLVIACANVSNLFLARAESRQRELAVRSALGAARARLLAALLSEAIVISALGGMLGLGLAVIGVRSLQSIDAAAAIPRLSEVHIDGFVIGLTAAVAALAALIVSALPLLRLNGMSLASVLASSGRSATTGRSRNRARRALVVAQVALAVALVFGAGLFARTFARLRAVDSGFKAEHALAFRIALPDATYPATRDGAGMIVRSLNAIDAIPGVSASGVITKLPLDAEAAQDSAVFVEDHPLRKGETPSLHQINFTSPGYFKAMGIPVVAGHLFAAPEANGVPYEGPPELVVSSAFAVRFWRSPTSAIGKRIKMNALDPWKTIVGVVGDVHAAGLDQPATAEVYSPLVTLNAAGKPWMPRNLAFIVRSSADASALARPVRSAMNAIDPALPLYRVMPLRELLTAATARTSFTSLLLAIAALVATVIGGFGIYGVISYLVGLRTREIGVRLALGADSRDVRLLVTRQAMTEALIGVVLGAASSFVVARGLQSSLADVKPADAPVMLGASAALFVTAFVASWVPARRASRLDPSIALHAD